MIGDRSFLNKEIILENDRVLLLPFHHPRNAELKDIIFDNDIWKFMGMRMEHQQDFDTYLSQTLKEYEQQSCLPFLIVDKRNNRVAGSSRFGNINLISEKCEIGWTWYGKDFQGTGLNKACKYELLRFGFEEIKFRRIQFSVDVANLRSQRAVTKLGAVKEGTFRNNYISVAGESRDDVYFSIIKEEWPRVKKTYFKDF